jgi:RNA ligase (TIGR02306 family)
MHERKMATVRRIAEVKTIDGADRIVAYRVDGWYVVDSKDKYQVGDLVVYCEPDSWIPHSIAPFLTKPDQFPKVYKSVEGQKLRTIRLKGQISQGLLLPVAEFFGETVILTASSTDTYKEGDDVSEALGIQKWEAEIPAQLQGQMKGSFPSFIRKTDQERVQNVRDLQQYRDVLFEVTEKLEGSSMTVYFRDGESGVCSRNVELKDDGSNTFWQVAKHYDLENKLRSLGCNIALQGELIGPNIQGNIYKLQAPDFYVFDVFDIDIQVYYSSVDRLAICNLLGLKHAPVIAPTLQGLESANDYLIFAEGQTCLLTSNHEREGLVFKSVDGSFSFKAISNRYLLKQKD